MTTKTKTQSTKTATPKPRKVKPRTIAPEQYEKRLAEKFAYELEEPSQLDRIEERLKQMEERLHHSITTREPLFENIQRDLTSLSERIDAQRMERYALDHAQLDRIEQTLSMIRSGMETDEPKRPGELDYAAMRAVACEAISMANKDTSWYVDKPHEDRVALLTLSIAKAQGYLGDKTFRSEAPKPAGLQPGDYCQSDEHHSLKEVAERLTAMGWEWFDGDRDLLKYIRYGMNSARGKMINIPSETNATKYPTPEFLSRAGVTAKELGLTPVVPEPWRPKVNGLAKYDGLVGKVTDHSTSVGEWWFIDGRWVPTHKISEPSPAEVAAHQAEVAAKEEAARTPKFGSMVEYQDDKGWRVVCDNESRDGWWSLSKPSTGATSFTKRHEFKIMP